MALTLSHTTLNALNPYSLAEFWRELLGWERAGDYGPDDDECYLRGPMGQTLLLYRVSEPKPVSWNRMHLDLAPDAGAQDAEVDRAVSLGARVVADNRPGSWVVMGDPEGNEFCILS